ncbi:MAG: hypothetical protein ACTSSB_02230 [Candidatus Heimdallarchaeota archaeon]
MTLRLILSLVIITSLALSIILPISHSSILFVKAQTTLAQNDNLNSQSTLQEYSFNSLGIAIAPFSWSGIGSFSLTYNKTFDFNNNGPTLLILSFTSNGDQPDFPGFELTGEFNTNSYSSTIINSIVPTDGVTTRELVIPLYESSRTFGNYFEITIEAESKYSSGASGTLTILDDSKFLVGDVLEIEANGNFPTDVYPKSLTGRTSIGGVSVYTALQFTITNNTLVDFSEFLYTTHVEFQGDVSINLRLIAYDGRDYDFQQSETSSNEIDGSVQFIPKVGSNFFLVEVRAYGANIWSIDFNVTFTSNYLTISTNPDGPNGGLGDLEIPFFQWPSTPIIGIIVLALWVLPYTILKYREWKKMPGEVEINVLDDDESINIMDPEGMSSGDDYDDDIEEVFDFDED